MHPLAENILFMLLTQAVQAVPNLIRMFADPAQPNPTPPSLESDQLRDAVKTIATAVAVSIAETAYLASLDRPHVTRANDPPLQTATQ